MPPIFFSHDFSFENDLIPEHFESEYASTAERDPTKYWLEYYDYDEPEADASSWALAVDVDSLEEAEVLKAARIRYLERADKPKSEEERAEILGSVAIHGPEDIVDPK